jgi:hypothetical protein
MKSLGLKRVCLEQSGDSERVDVEKVGLLDYLFWIGVNDARDATSAVCNFHQHHIIVLLLLPHCKFSWRDPKITCFKASPCEYPLFSSMQILTSPVRMRPQHCPETLRRTTRYTNLYCLQALTDTIRNNLPTCTSCGWCN